MSIDWRRADDAELIRMHTRLPRAQLAEHMTRFVGRQVTRGAVSKRVQKLRAEGVIEPAVRPPWNAAEHRDRDKDIEIPIDVDAFVEDDEDTDTFRRDGPAKNDTEPVPTPAADRAYVDRPEGSHDLPPLDCGSSTPERVLILPDTHAPYHDKRAWALAMKFAREFRPHTVVHLGDWADCFTISDHSKDPRRGSQLSEELAVVRETREEVDALNPERKIITLGNHCDRLYRYCAAHAPALLGFMRIEELLELPQNGWHVVPYRKHGSIGRMHLTHEAGYAGVHAIHHTGNAFASSVIFGHTHRLGATYFGDVTGKRYVSASLGWLGSMPEADYEHWAKRMRFWQHAFGTSTIEPGGNFHLQLHPIVDGRVIHHGQVVEL